MTKTLPNGTRLITLPNGFRIILVRKRDTEAATILLGVGIGSKHEPPSLNGLTHFLEHMMFQGSRAYPSSESMNNAVARIGGDFNATTGVEYTHYILQVPDASLEEGLEIVADTVVRPLFKESLIPKEREVVASEIGEQDDDPDATLQNLFEDQLYAGSGLGRPIAGNIRLLRRQHAVDMRNLHKRAYTPDNMALVLVSDRPQQDLAELAKMRFGSLQGHERKNRVLKPKRIDSIRMKHQDASGEQTYLVVGGLAPHWLHPDKPGMDLAMSVLGGSMQARLPRLLRDEAGSVYNVRSLCESYVECGSYATFTDTKYTRVLSVLDVIVDQYRELRDYPVSKDEFEMAKQTLIGTLVVQLDEQDNLAEFYANRLLLRGIFSDPNAQLNVWNKQTVTDVRRVAKRWLKPEQFVAGFYGRAPSRAKILSHLR